MNHGIRRVLLAILAASVAGRAGAQDKCSAKGVMAGTNFTMTHCAVALYDDKSVSLWFSESSLPADEVKTFHTNSYPNQKGPDGKPRTMIALGFCPGGGKPIPSPTASTPVEMAFYRETPMVWTNWLFQLPNDKELKFEKLSGELKAGGKLTGRLTGKKAGDDGKPYSWEIDFDLRLPDTLAAAGLACD